LDEAAVVLRTAACAYVIFLACSKVPDLVGHRVSVYWRPPMLTASVARCALGLAVGFESMLAGAVGAGVAKGPWTAGAAAGLGAVLTIYGLLALRAGASCGCGGSQAQQLTGGRRLMLRNLTLFGVLAATSLLAPALTATDADAFALAGLTPAPLFVAILTARLVLVCKTPSGGVPAPHTRIAHILRSRA